MTPITLSPSMKRLSENDNCSRATRGSIEAIRLGRVRVLTVLIILCVLGVCGQGLLEYALAAGSENPKGDLYGLVIGITSYKNSNIPSVKNAAKDAEDIRSFLRSQKGLYKNIHIKSLIGKRATKARIERTIRHGFLLAGPNDNLISFISGQGFVSSDPEKGLYIMAYDSDPDEVEATGVSLDFGTMLEKMEAKLSLMIVDAAYSQSIGAQDTRKVDERLLSAIRFSDPIPNRLIMAYNRNLELNGNLKDIENGPFTHFFLQGLQGPADLDNNGTIVTQEIYEYVAKEIEKLTSSGEQIIYEGLKRDPLVLRDLRLKDDHFREPDTNEFAHRIKGDLYAVVIGVSKYDSRIIPDLDFAAKDATDFGAFLSTQTQLYNKIHLHTLIDDEATKDKISAILANNFKTAKENDTHLLFFSGHGASLPGREDEYFGLLRDTDPNRLVHTSLLLSSMGMIKEVKTKRAIIISDTCFAGSSVDLQSSSGGLSLEKFARMFKTHTNRLVLASSRTQEQSMEYPNLKNGVFTHFLIKALKGAADGDRDGIVTVREAYDYVSTQTERFTKGTQSPVLEGRIEGPFPLSTVTGSE